jgi:predicted dehydrogenase
MKDGRVRVAVVGVGDFGRNHARVYRQLEGTELVGVLDADSERARRVADEFGTGVLPDLDSLSGRVDAASVAVPTREHARIGSLLMAQGIDVLVEKPIAASLSEADLLAHAARQYGRVMQVGHLERFNPAFIAVLPIIKEPLYFEVHRLGVFSPRSLDIDVVYDVMIHDLDILLTLADSPVTSIHALGIPVITDKVDIAHARLEFESGAVANLTASRVSTERVRKLRLFQPHEYISLDYSRKDAVRFRVKPAQGPLGEAPLRGRDTQDPPMAIDFSPLPVTQEEPLKLELEAFFESVATRHAPVVTGEQGLAALEVASAILDRLEEHSRLVARTLQNQALQRG